MLKAGLRWGFCSSTLTGEAFANPFQPCHTSGLSRCVRLCLAVSEHHLQAHASQEKIPKQTCHKVRASSLFPSASPLCSAPQLSVRADESFHSRRSGMVEKFIST